MPLDRQILVVDADHTGIANALDALLAPHPYAWRVTIRPSPNAGHWSIEISRPGLFVACAAGPAHQTAPHIKALVKGALLTTSVAMG